MIDAPATRTSSDLVFRTLAVRRSTHTAYLVWRLLESCVVTGQPLPTNGALGEQLGLTGRTVQFALALLHACGLLHVVYTVRAQTRQVFLYPFGLDFANDVLGGIAAGRLALDLDRGVVIDQTTHLPLEMPEWTGVPSFHPASGFTPPETDLSAATDADCTLSETKPIMVGVVDLVLCKDTTQSAMNSASTEVPVNSISTATNSQVTNHDVGPVPAKKGRPRLPITDDMRLVYSNWARAVGKARVRTLVHGLYEDNIRQRLADGFSIDDLELVAQWAQQDPWMSGQDPRARRQFLGCDTLYRSLKQTDKYLEQALAWRSGKLGGFDRRQTTLSAHTPVVGVETF